MFPARSVAFKVYINDVFLDIPGIQSWKLLLETETERVFPVGKDAGVVFPVAKTVSVECYGFLVWSGFEIDAVQRFVFRAARLRTLEWFRMVFRYPNSNYTIDYIEGSGYFFLKDYGGSVNTKTNFSFRFTFAGEPTFSDDVGS